MKLRILAVVGLVLFATAAVFWADYYTYMVASRETGHRLTVVEYARSVQNRMAGRPDAIALRRTRVAESERAVRTPIPTVSVSKLNGVEVDSSQFVRAGHRPAASANGVVEPGFGSAVTGSASKMLSQSGGGGVRFVQVNR